LDSVGSKESNSGTSNNDTNTDMHLVIEESIIRELEKVINIDVIPDMVSLNFPPERRAQCTVTIEKLTITRKLMLKELLMKLMGVINQFARDGGLFRVLPDFAEILKLLEIPMANIGDVIDLKKWSAGNKKPPGGDKAAVPEDDISKEEKIKENNKDKNRSPRTRTEKRKKTAA
jgi:hypothetical protein